MAAISLLNPKAEFARAAQALAVNISAAKGIQDVMRTNLGPKGTMKMYVSARSRAAIISPFQRGSSAHVDSPRIYFKNVSKPFDFECTARASSNFSHQKPVERRDISMPHYSPY